MRTKSCGIETFFTPGQKTLPDCPPGRLIRRRTTKSNNSTERYARDCHTLYMFTQGEKSGLNVIFDKSKTIPVPSDTFKHETSKIEFVEFRSLLQLLQQRLSELEENIQSKDKTIHILTADLKSLHLKHDQLSTEHERLKAEANCRFTKYDCFQKLAKEKFQKAETDTMEFESFKSKTNDELRRVNKVTQNFQNKVNALSPNKTYASTVVEQTAIERSIKENSTTSRGNDAIVDGIRSIRDSMDNPSKPKTSDTSGKTCADKDVAACAPVTNDSPRRVPQEAGHNAHSPDTSSFNSPRSNSHTITTAGLKYAKNRDSSPESITPKRSVNYGGVLCRVTVDEKPRSVQNTVSKQTKDVFLGVTYKKAARYYLSGINHESTYEGIKTYVESKGVKISYLTLFKPKGRYSVRTAKINVSPNCSETVEAPGFWPDGVHCRKWYSEREWDSRCDQRYPQTDDERAYQDSHYH